MSERTHRHELEKNILADWLGEKIEQLKPYGVQLGVGALVAIVAIVGAVAYFSQTDTVTPRAWQAYLSAFGEKKVAESLQAAYEKDEVRGTPAELWARISYAGQRFRFAAVQAAQDSTEAKTALADAEKALLPIEEEKKTSDPDILSRSRYLLARVYETQGKLDKAREMYQKVAETNKDTAFGKAAATGLARLDPDSDVSQVIAWLAEQKPSTTTPGSGNSFLDSLGPGFGQPGPTLPERPNLNIPGSSSPFGPSGTGGIDFGRDDPLGTKGTAPAVDAPQLDAPTGAKPAANDGDSKTDDDPKPAETKSADEKPAGEKAGDDTPAKGESGEAARP